MAKDRPYQTSFAAINHEEVSPTQVGVDSTADFGW